MAESRRYADAERHSGSKKRRKKKAAFQKKKANKMNILLVAVTVLAATIVMVYGYVDLSQKRADLKERAETLQSQIDDETNRSQQLENFETYTHTKKFAEETAKELGYVYEDEIVFKLED